jgi:phosphatidate cytidylyltransferase
VIFILGGFWLHPVSFFITGLLLLAFNQYEYYQIIKDTGRSPRIITGIISGCALYIISTLVASGFLKHKYFMLLIPFAVLIMIIQLYKREERPFDSIAHTFFAIVYIAVPFSLFPFSAFSKEGFSTLLPHPDIVFSPGIVIGFLLILWANDTGAYLIGITLGKHRLMERVSPGKSWEGFLGGMIIALLAGWLLSGWINIIDLKGWLIVSLLVSIAGVYGDLIESMLKRSVDVKDSGSILPGHGGFLDRFDSALVSFPLVYLYILFFG